MIHEVSGSIFESEAVALVNPVNTVGVSGKGLALQFKQKFPRAFDQYSSACFIGAVRPGLVLAVRYPKSNKYIIHFPTKRHWRSPSRIEDIESGLVGLIDVLREEGIQSVAIPALGCGLGGLNWKAVKQLIENAFHRYPTIEVYLYGPQ